MPEGAPILLRNSLKETGGLKSSDATDLLRHPDSTGLDGRPRSDIFAANASTPPIFGFLLTRYAFYINLGEKDGVTRFIDIASQVDGDTAPSQIETPAASPSLATPAHHDGTQFEDDSPVDDGANVLAERKIERVRSRMPHDS